MKEYGLAPIIMAVSTLAGFLIGTNVTESMFCGAWIGLFGLIVGGLATHVYIRAVNIGIINGFLINLIVPISIYSLVNQGHSFNPLALFVFLGISVAVAVVIILLLPKVAMVGQVVVPAV